ncbi:MAG: hypothetical protein ACJAXH_001242 [Colwellia sp.]|jgi:hypothetical protein
MKINKIFKGTDYVGLITTIIIWNYIYQAISSGSINIRSLHFDKLTQPGGFWFSIFMMFFCSVVCLWFVFFYHPSEE